jgi:hypothetical protein
MIQTARTGRRWVCEETAAPDDVVLARQVVDRDGLRHGMTWFYEHRHAVGSQRWDRGELVLETRHFDDGMEGVIDWRKQKVFVRKTKGSTYKTWEAAFDLGWVDLQEGRGPQFEEYLAWLQGRLPPSEYVYVLRKRNEFEVD